MPYQLTGEEFSQLFLNRSAVPGPGSRSDALTIDHPDVFRFSIQTDFLPFGSVNRMQGVFYQDLRVKEVLANRHVGLHVQLAGNGGGYFSGMDQPTKIQSGCHNLYFHSQPCGDLLFPAQSEYEYLVVLLDPDWLLHRLQGNPDLHPALLDNLIRQRSCTAYRTNLVITPQMRATLHALANCSLRGGLRSFFLEGKILELLVQQFEQFPTDSPSTSAAVARSDQERLHQVRTYLAAHCSQPGTLADIARRFGLNEFKLKKEFKILFGQTVWTYVTECRLAYARQLLLDTEQQVNEAAWQAGYENVSHFIQLFQKRYGVRPGMLKPNRSSRRQT